AAPPAPSAAGPAPDRRDGLRALAELFSAAGVPAPLTSRTAARLGADAAAQLRADPWRLLRVPGVRPPQADHFARAVLGAVLRPAAPRRGRPLSLPLRPEAARGGHAFPPPPGLLAALEPWRCPDPGSAVQAELHTADFLLLREEP